MAALTNRPRRRGPLFTTRHYKVVADLLRARWQNQTMDAITLNAVISDLADLFDDDNSRFRRDKFLAAIGQRRTNG